MKFLLFLRHHRNSAHPLKSRFQRLSQRGFALISTLMLMVLLSMLALAMLGLSSVTLRSGKQDSSFMEARANARMALMIALGELQEEMGPDTRVSTESAMFDSTPNTPDIDGVAQARWMASYDAWSNWLNAPYSPPDQTGSLTIQDTYTARREPMFRRWLLSLPENMQTNINAPNLISDWDNSNSVIMVGTGSLGESARPENITRAYLQEVETGGRCAWWITPENHRALINKSKIQRTLETDAWQTAQGDTAEVGITGLEGFDVLDDENLSSKLLSHKTLEVTGIERSLLESHFLDLTAHSKGILASVRSGHLKKDLSLLFEKPAAQLPAEYRFTAATDTREPSIRPMSTDLSSKNPQIAGRHFQSWTNMRHFYRMYRQSSDATVKGYAGSHVNTPNNINNPGGGIGGSGNLSWDARGPYTLPVATANFCDRDLYNRWPGYNNYWRFPILAKITFIFSLRTTVRSVGPPARYDYDLLYTPVYTYWNPYNVRLKIPDQQMVVCTSAYPTIPLGRELFSNNNFINEGGINPSTGITYGVSYLRSSDGGEIVFEPGELRVFSYSSVVNNTAPPLNLYPGFDPLAINGDYIRVLNNQPASYNAGVAMRVWNSEWGGNINSGNTAGSLHVIQNWAATDPRNQTPSIPIGYQNDWFNVSQQREYITPNPRGAGGAGAINRFTYSDSNPVPIGYIQLALKGQSQCAYESISWGREWRSKNWIYGAPFYFGHNMYASENADTLQTQRLENPYVMNFGPISMSELPKVVSHQGGKAFLGSGSNPFEKVSQVAAIELPSAPVSSMAGFSGMRINPGWTSIRSHLSHMFIPSTAGDPRPVKSLYGAEYKAVAYQSGVTGPGIGNSFMHPVIPRDDVYRFFNNSISMDPTARAEWATPVPVDTRAYSDYWDHVFLLNDALWDDYFVSSLADQTRPGASAAVSLNANLDRLIAGDPISNSRYEYYAGGKEDSDVLTDLQGADGYLKAAQYLMVDGMFNVNSTSVAAWYSLFAGIRERKVVYRNNNGELAEVAIPNGKRIAISRFDTEVTDQEMEDPENGTTFPDGSKGWSGVRFLDDDQLMKLAEECVKQVKKRGPFLNYSEFINRRLSDDELGTMGALQSAIDYDDNNPDSASINYRFKNGPDFMVDDSDLGNHDFASPEAAVGSCFSGIPGYVIQSDLLKPISNTLSVRDDTFRIRAYGEALDSNGKVIAKAWCEAVVQRIPEYVDPANEPSVPARRMNATTKQFEDNPDLLPLNRKFGRKFQISNFRWLNSSEI